LALVAAWLAWFLLGQVGIYEVTDQAHLEVQTAAHPVAVQVSGRVVSSVLDLGHLVKAGEVLVKLDSDTEWLALEEARARVAGLQSQIEALGREIQAEREGLDAYRRASKVALDDSRARTAQAEADARFAGHRAEARQVLRGQRMVSEEDLSQAVAQAESGRAGVRALALATARLEQESTVETIDRQARIAALERKRVELQAELTTAEVAARRLAHEVERRCLRAPIDGHLGQVQRLSVGAVVSEVQVVGFVVPAGDPRAVALFPVTAVGRLHVGQTARLRIDGFPWTQYGLLAGTVTAVGNEPLDGHIRVELMLDRASAPRIPLEHGLSGTAEVEVERTSPAALVLRTVGRWLSDKGSARAAARTRPPH
jgi:membrane fusion protein (multidrug efflux system)